MQACEFHTNGFCSLCLAVFHFHTTSCREAASKKDHWKRWNEHGRAEYHGQQDRQRSELDARASQQYARDIEIAERNHEILEADERRKADRMVQCPKCKRLIEMVELRCGIAVCGKDYHGGNQQSGCGHQFDVAKDGIPYIPQIGSARTAQFEQPDKGSVGGRTHNLLAEIDDTNDPNLQLKCSLCDEAVRGIILRCLNCCPTFYLCQNCDAGGCSEDGIHFVGHVFEIMHSLHEADAAEGKDAGGQLGDDEQSRIAAVELQNLEDLQYAQLLIEQDQSEQERSDAALAGELSASGGGRMG